MKRKLLFVMFAAIGMMLATSCSNDEQVVQSGNEVRVTFSLGLENAMYADAKEFYKLPAGQTVGELGILFPRIDADKEFEELAKIQEENAN